MKIIHYFSCRIACYFTIKSQNVAEKALESQFYVEELSFLYHDPPASASAELQFSEVLQWARANGCPSDEEEEDSSWGVSDEDV